MAEDLKKLESLSYRPAKSSSATSGFNSVVIRPEMKVNKAEDVEQTSPNLKIIGEIEGLISQVNDKLDILDRNTCMLPCQQPKLIAQTLEAINKFQKTTLVELKTAFKD